MCDSGLSKARLQFNLECPENDQDFQSDFILAIHRIEELQDAVARDLGPDRKYLVLNNNGSKCLRLSSEIFVAPKVRTFSTANHNLSNFPILSVLSLFSLIHIQPFKRPSVCHLSSY